MSLDENHPRGNAAEPRVIRLASPAPGIDLWWCALDASPAVLDICRGYLSDAERTRMARFGVQKLRDRYAIGRATLRTLLAGALNADASPASVPIVRGVRGRPCLAGNNALDFNVSHTADVALIALARRARVGVDVERLDRAINVAGIARKFLSENERRQLASLDADAARRRVLALWTCKEAMSKATGDAMSAPFSALDVAWNGGPMLVAGPGAYDPAHWSLRRAAVPRDYVATVALWRTD